MAKARKGISPKTSEASERTVAVNVNVPIDMLKLLQDVALATVLDDVATAAKGTTRTKSKNAPDSVASVIVDVLERHLAELEHKARTVRDSGKK